VHLVGLIFNNFGTAFSMQF